MPSYVITPHCGVGPVRFGMKRDEVRAQLGVHVETFHKVPTAESATDAFDDAGFHVYYGSATETVEFIEVFPAEGCNFILYGMDVFSNSARAVVGHLRAQETVVEEEESTTYLLPNRDTSLWRQDPKQVYFESIGVGQVDYFREKAV